MKRDSITQTFDLTGRIKDLEQFTGSLVRRHAEADLAVVEAIPVHDAPVTRLPVPRRSRVFLRSGQGHGAFAELTLTAPLPRTALD